MTVSGRPPSGPIRRPPPPVPQPGERLPLGAAIKQARAWVNDAHTFILITSRQYPVSIQGDAHSDIYWIHYRNRANQVEIEITTSYEALVRWLTARDLSAGLGDWNATIFPNIDQLGTLRDTTLAHPYLEERFAMSHPPQDEGGDAQGR